MNDNSNILLVTDFEEIAKTMLEKLILLRSTDCITVCNNKNLKKTLENSVFSVVILHENEDIDFTLKQIRNIKEIKNDTEILLLLNSQNIKLILKAYDAGIFDYFTIEAEEFEILIKTVNCFKIRSFSLLNLMVGTLKAMRLHC